MRSNDLFDIHLLRSPTDVPIEIIYVSLRAEVAEIVIGLISTFWVSLVCIVAFIHLTPRPLKIPASVS